MSIYYYFGEIQTFPDPLGPKNKSLGGGGLIGSLNLIKL
jgi:hypothetical protein